ncbi:unnamed protein product [Callosobruchus maculatus]|uniref:Aldehyde dehydrogenase domain-containing protein n=1 Tax=Callosobruchus maculatus TaxID=64391 RepID=A0A653BEI9_CALMS|nr:unnamed protein product [Callosobruchus maculatus]
MGPPKPQRLQQLQFLSYATVAKLEGSRQCSDYKNWRGKSPVFIDSSVDIETAARRVMWGKCANAGQTCVAPDYVLCTRDTADRFVSAANKVIKEFFGEDPKRSEDFGRIVNDRHFARVAALMKGCDIAVGGQTDSTER